MPKKVKGETKDMSVRTAPESSGGDYDLSNPVGSFVDVVRRVVTRPAATWGREPFRRRAHAVSLATTWNTGNRGDTRSNSASGASLSTGICALAPGARPK
jgi:hypothetical protein